MNAEILSVGTELLLGHTTNTDARDLSEMLSELGINVFWHTVVGDNPGRLTDAVALARTRADLIITTGGLGPTYDDLTKQTLAKAFGLELYRDEEEEKALRAWFAAKKGSTPFTENNLQQADLPVGCTVLHNDWGTAPGCAFEKDGVHVIMLPGPPHECIAMFRHRAVPYLRAITEGEMILSHKLNMMGIGESEMESKLRPLMQSLNNPTLAPYAKTGECFVRVTAKAATEEECEAMMVPVIEAVREQVGEFIYGVDADSLEQVVSELLRSQGKTLAAAESCTGGLLAARMTEIPGASDVFRGGATVYTVDAKAELLGIKRKFIEENGVVSAAVAAKMAKKIRKKLGADFGIGITGWAGPGGDDVGLVYVGFAWEGESVVRRLNCGTMTRDRIRAIAVNNALDMVRRHLCGDEL